jgi:hypothetical protein
MRVFARFERLFLPDPPKEDLLLLGIQPAGRSGTIVEAEEHHQSHGHRG